MTHAHNHRKPVVDRGIKSLAASVLLLAALFLWNQLHVGSCLALGLPTLACLTACYGIFTYRLERKRFALMYWLDPGSSLHALLKRHGMIAVISLFLGVSLTGLLAIFTALARRTDWYFICAIAVATPLVFTALRIWPGRHFRQTSAGHTALAEILAARLAGWLVFAGAAAGYVYANYYLPVPGDYIYPDSLERTVEAFATQTGSACPLVDDTLRIAGMIEGLSWYSVTTGTSLAAVSRELKWLVWAGFFLNTSVVFIGFIRSLEGALLLACRTERHHPDVGTAGSIHRLAESAKASKAER